MVSFAGRTGTKVTAEGIENPAELMTVTDLGMDAAQATYSADPRSNLVNWARGQTHA
ncbi:MAG: hypothetical protein QOD87_418, partial [Pseudonocardiales bacterium]|nr:hypothetical protein [Pseudonocardiales bacterium]